MKISIPDEAKIVISGLANYGYETRVCGGFVRDSIMGLPPHDIDMATTASPDAVIQILTGDEYGVHPTGIDHGTVTAIINDVPIEITTLRTDSDTDGRHATVQYVHDWELDSNRRDFTINAMYANSEGHVYDFHGGIEDSHKLIIRFVGDAFDRIEEDYLRVLRLFRFGAKYAGATVEGIEATCTNKALAGLKTLSRERIHDELIKLSQCVGAPGMFRTMINVGIMDALGFPALKSPSRFLNRKWIKTADKIDFDDVPEKTVDDLVLAGMFFNHMSDEDIPLLPDYFFTGLKSSRKTHKFLNALVASMDESFPDAAVNKHGEAKFVYTLWKNDTKNLIVAKRIATAVLPKYVSSGNLYGPALGDAIRDYQRDAYQKMVDLHSLFD